MGTSKQGNKTLIFLSMFAILILCLGFILIGCGSGIGPQGKVVNPNAVQNAIDFTNCTGTSCRVMVVIDDSAATDFPIDDRPLTTEAWVKVKSTSTSGYIYGRIEADGGITLLVNNNVPNFSIRHTRINATSTDKIVVSNVSLVQNIWTHIAGVLSTTVHDDVTDHNTLIASCDAGVGAELPHLDIHVDGVFAGCATTALNFSDSPNLQTAGVGVNGESGVEVAGVSNTVNFNGIIDEVRIWGVERTSAEINACMNQELGLSGTCSRMNSGMVGYMRFNEGQGHSTADWIGLGSGVKEKLGPLHEWDEGWSSDTPF